MRSFMTKSMASRELIQLREDIKDARIAQDDAYKEVKEAELWKKSRMKALRDLLVEEERLLQ